jgi:hypothetical protein
MAIAGMLAFDLAEKNYFDCPYDIYSDQIKGDHVPCFAAPDGYSPCTEYTNNSNAADCGIDEGVVSQCYLDVFRILLSEEKERLERNAKAKVDEGDVK